MKILKLKMIANTLLILTLIFALTPIGVSAEWKHDSNGWWNTEGNVWSVGWRLINEKWYYFGQDGYMVYDTTIDGYYLGSDGAWVENRKIESPQISKKYDINSDTYNKGWTHSANGWKNTEVSYITGWQLIEGKYYFFDIDGAMQYSKIVDGYYLGSDGAWDSTKGQAKLQNITMTTEKIVYSLGTKNINVYITNNTNLESIYGRRYTVDKFENNEWHELPFATDKEFQSTGMILNPQKTNNENCDLNTLKEFKNLTPGKYRIIEEISNLIGYTHATAEFELK